MRRLKSIISTLIGISILFYIIFTLDAEKILDLILRIRVGYFIIAGIFYFFVELSASILLKIAISRDIPFIEILKSHLLGMLYSNATPGRVGYYYVAFSLARKSNSSRSEIIGILTLFQGLNFLVKIFLCMISAIYFSEFIVSQESRIYLFLISSFPIIIVIGILISIYTNILNRIIAGTPILNLILGYVEKMQYACREIEGGRIHRMILLLLIGWLLMGFQFYFISKSLNFDINYLAALMLQPLLTTITFVPISPSGIGIAEGGSSLLFKIIGLTLENGVAFMLLVRFNSILVDSLGLLDLRRFPTK